MNRNLFDLDNARYLHKKELVETFIETEAFGKLLSPKNQIIIGSRGSGKTALLKMLSHDHLSLFDNEVAKRIIQDKTYIGIHISTKTKFSGGLKNKSWQTESERENHFKWLMNIASCVAFLDTVKSCLNIYIHDKVSKIEKELKVVDRIRKIWFSNEEDIFTIDDLAQKFEQVVIEKATRDIEYKMYGKLEDKKIIGIVFELELFDPLIAAINAINRVLDFNETTSWFICVDEIEILDEFHHRILNSYMRANMGNIFFKFTTLPYCHYTLETNLNVPLDIRHDVHYIYIDQDKSFHYRAMESTSNALKLYRKRARISKPEFAQYNFVELFGKSDLLDTRNIDYSEIDKFDNPTLNKEQLAHLINSDRTLYLFAKHANERTRSKGLDLLRQKRVSEFGDQFGRKLRALLYLKEYENSISGNQRVELYYGAKTVINVGDANPRKLIGIFNEMLSDNIVSRIKITNRIKKDIIARKDGDLENRKDEDPIIPSTIQHFILATVAEKEINRYRIEKNFGSSLYDFINEVGNYMHDHIHKNKINTEQVSSIELDESTNELIWAVVQRAVQKGLLYPNINIHNPDDMPIRKGVFHLGFIFAPKYKLLPRKGDARNISTILSSGQLTIKFNA